jgi:ribonuclease HII
MGSPKKATPRVREHVNTLREAGLDTQKFFDALVAIRDDSALARPQRDALYKLVAMESFVWYIEAIRNEEIDRTKLADEINKLAIEYDAAMRTEKPGERAADLLKKDLGKKKT